MLCVLGMATLACGDHAAARVYVQESWALSHDAGMIWEAANALLGEGHVAFAERTVGVGIECCQEALRCFVSLPSWDDRRRRVGLAACLASLAGTISLAVPTIAARLFSVSAALRATVEPATLQLFDVHYILMGNRPANDVALARVRANLGDAAFEAAWAAGQALTLDQAVAEAQELRADSPSLDSTTP